MFVTVANELGGDTAQRKCDDGGEVAANDIPVAGGKIDTQKKKIACLSIGKYLATCEIGIGIHQATR